MLKTLLTGGGYNVVLSEHRRFSRKGFASKVRDKEQWEKGMTDAQENGQEFCERTGKNPVRFQRAAVGICVVLLHRAQQT